MGGGSVVVGCLNGLIAQKRCPTYEIEYNIMWFLPIASVLFLCFSSAVPSSSRGYREDLCLFSGRWSQSMTGVVFINYSGNNLEAATHWVHCSILLYCCNWRYFLFVS